MAKIDAKELAEKYHVTVRTISNWVSRGLPYTVEYTGIRAKYVFDEKVADKWVKEQKQ